jgi:hypothetical protein
MKIDPNNTWSLVEQRFHAETDPRRKRNLELVLMHMKAEALADIEAVVATLTESPRYVMHANPDDVPRNPTGSKDAVRAFYDLSIVQTGAHRLEFACERVIADDDAVFTEGIMYMAYPGTTLSRYGIQVDDPEAYYLAVSRMGIVWPVDLTEDRLTGEEVYSSGNAFEGIADRKIALADIAEVVPA